MDKKLAKQTKNYPLIRASNRGSCLGSLFAFCGIIISVLWLLNLQMGIFFEIPDNLPVVGNLDEVFFVFLLISSLSYFGIEIPYVSEKLGKYSKNDMRKH